MILPSDAPEQGEIDLDLIAFVFKPIMLVLNATLHLSQSFLIR